jgi:hypothetical protein
MGERLKDIPGFSIDKVAAAAGSDPEMLRMENLDTDIPPPTAAVEATRARASAAVCCRLSLRSLGERGVADICCTQLQFVASTALPRTERS